MMLLKDKIKELKNIDYKDSKKVFTMYLNTDPRSPDQQKGEWKIRLKNALKDLADSTKNSHSHEEKQQAKIIRQKVEKEIFDKQHKLLRSHILFATAEEDLWFSEPLNIPVETEFHWENKPDLKQLENLEQSYPYTGIIVVQQNEVAVLETEIGRLVDQTYYTLDMSTEDWREHQGSEKDVFSQGGARKDEIDNHVKANQQRWFNNLIPKLEKKAKDKNWKQIYLVGEKDEITPLKPYFNKNIDKTIPRNLLNWDTNEILTAALEE